MSRRIKEVAFAVLLGALAVGMLIAVAKLVATNDHTAAAPTVTAAVPEKNEPVDPEDFLADYERSLVGPYVARGSIVVRNDGIEIDTTTYKSVRRGEQGFEQEGTSIVMVDNGSQAACDQLASSTETTCGPTVEALTNIEVVNKARTLLTPQGDQARADYEVYADDDDCWLLIGTHPMVAGEWGQTSIWCFGAETGALVRQETSTGTRTTLRLADSVEPSVTDDDFQPDTP